MRRAAFALVTAAGIMPASASTAEIVTVGVTHDDGVYHVTIEALLDAPRDAVFAVLTDYARWADVNDMIEESVVLEGATPAEQLVRTVAEGCALGFCKTFTQVQWMRATDGRRIEAQIVPERSDMRSGWVRTELSDADGRTLFHYEMSLEPDFWVPPLIGPWIIQRKLRAESIQTAAAVELAARP